MNGYKGKHCGRIPEFLCFAGSINSVLPKSSFPCKSAQALSASSCSSKVTKANPRFRVQRANLPKGSNRLRRSSSLQSRSTFPVI